MGELSSTCQLSAQIFRQQKAITGNLPLRCDLITGVGPLLLLLLLLLQLVCCICSAPLTPRLPFSVFRNTRRMPLAACPACCTR